MLPKLGFTAGHGRKARRRDESSSSDTFFGSYIERCMGGESHRWRGALVFPTSFRIEVMIMKLIYIIIALILSGAILANGVLNFISKQNELRIEKKKIEAEVIMRAKDYLNQGDLEKCLAEAKAEFEKLSDLNSVKSTTPDGQEARKWNSSEIKLETGDQYNKDREFCLKLYK